MSDTEAPPATEVRAPPPLFFSIVHFRPYRDEIFYHQQRTQFILNLKAPVQPVAEAAPAEEKVVEPEPEAEAQAPLADAPAEDDAPEGAPEEEHTGINPAQIEEEEEEDEEVRPFSFSNHSFFNALVAELSFSSSLLCLSFPLTEEAR